MSPQQLRAHAKTMFGDLTYNQELFDKLKAMSPQDRVANLECMRSKRLFSSLRPCNQERMGRALNRLLQKKQEVAALTPVL